MTQALWTKGFQKVFKTYWSTCVLLAVMGCHKGRPVGEVGPQVLSNLPAKAKKPFQGVWQYQGAVCQPASIGFGKIFESSGGALSVLPEATAVSEWNAFLHRIDTSWDPALRSAPLGSVLESDTRHPAGFFSLWMDPKIARDTRHTTGTLPPPDATWGPFWVLTETQQLQTPEGGLWTMESNADRTIKLGLFVRREEAMSTGSCPPKAAVWLLFEERRSLSSDTTVLRATLESEKEKIIERLKVLAQRANQAALKKLLQQVEAELQPGGSLIFSPLKNYELTDSSTGVSKKISEWVILRGKWDPERTKVLNEALNGIPMSEDGIVRGTPGLKRDLAGLKKLLSFYEARSDTSGNLISDAWLLKSSEAYKTYLELRASHGHLFLNPTRFEAEVLALGKEPALIAEILSIHTQRKDFLIQAILKKDPTAATDFEHFKAAGIEQLENAKETDISSALYQKIKNFKTYRQECLKLEQELNILLAPQKVLNAFLKDLQANENHPFFVGLRTTPATSGSTHELWLQAWKRWQEYQQPSFNWVMFGQFHFGPKATWKEQGGLLPQRTIDGSLEAIEEPTGGGSVSAAIDLWTVNGWELGKILAEIDGL